MKNESLRLKILLLVFSQVLALNFAFAEAWETHKYTSDLGQREFLFYSPGNIQTHERRPLIVALHGCLQNAKELAGLTRLQSLAKKEKAYLLLPNQNFLNNFNRCWNWHSANHQKRDRGEPGLIAGMIDWAKNHHQIDPRRVYIFGVSAGGAMTTILMANYPDVFSAGLSASGIMYKAATNMLSGYAAAKSGSDKSPLETAQQAWKDLKDEVWFPESLPILVITGDADTSCHPKNSEQTVEQFLAFNDLFDDGKSNKSVKTEPISQTTSKVENGYDYTHLVYGKNKNQVAAEYYVIHGMGHGWSGGNSDFDYNFPLGPNATEIMWNFFKRHRK